MKKNRIIIVFVICLMLLSLPVMASETKKNVQEIKMAVTTVTTKMKKTPNVSTTVHGAVISKYTQWDKTGDWQEGEIIQGQMELTAAEGFVFSRDVKLVRTENEGSGDNVRTVLERINSNKVKVHFYWTVSEGSSNGKTEENIPKDWWREEGTIKITIRFCGKKGGA